MIATKPANMIDAGHPGDGSEPVPIPLPALELAYRPRKGFQGLPIPPHSARGRDPGVGLAGLGREYQGAGQGPVPDPSGRKAQVPPTHGGIGAGRSTLPGPRPHTGAGPHGRRPARRPGAPGVALPWSDGGHPRDVHDAGKHTPRLAGHRCRGSCDPRRSSVFTPTPSGGVCSRPPVPRGSPPRGTSAAIRGGWEWPRTCRQRDGGQVLPGLQGVGGRRRCPSSRHRCTVPWYLPKHFGVGCAADHPET